MFFCEFRKISWNSWKNIFKEHACITTFEETLSHYGTTITWKWYTNSFLPFASLLNIPFVFRTDASGPEIFCNWSFVSKLLFHFKSEASFAELKLQFFNEAFFLETVASFTTWEINLHSKLICFKLLITTQFESLFQESVLQLWKRSFNSWNESLNPETKLRFQKRSFTSEK